MRIHLLSYLVALVLMGIVSVADAQNVIKSVSSAQMAAIFDGEGYSYDIDSDGDLIWKIDGYRTLMIIYSDNKSIQFRASFTDEATLKKVNEWNKRKRYSKSYLDDDGDPVLELDLDIDGGVTKARIGDFLKTCRDSFAVWRKEVLQ